MPNPQRPVGPPTLRCAALWMLAATVLAACGPQTGGRYNANKTPGAAPIASGDADATNANSATGTNTNTSTSTTPPPPPAETPLSNNPLLISRFAIASSLDEKGRLKLCDGNVTAKINANLRPGANAPLLELPNGVLNCKLVGAIDLGVLFGALSQPGDSGMTIQDNVLFVNHMGDGSYGPNPGRPLLPAFLSTKREDLAKLSVTRQVDLKNKNGDAGSGTISVHMLSFGQSYRSEALGRTFPDVLEVEIVTSGFAGIDKLGNFISDRMVMRLSLNPVAVLSISLSLHLNDLLDSSQKHSSAFNNTTQGLLRTLGKVENTPVLGTLVRKAGAIPNTELRMDLVHQDGLDKLQPTDDDEHIGTAAPH